MKYYTIGEIFRLGLLKNHKGEPYKHKATVSTVVRGMKVVRKKTAFGLGKFVPESEIKRHNKSVSFGDDFTVETIVALNKIK